MVLHREPASEESRRNPSPSSVLRHNPLLAPQPAPSAGGVDEWSARTNDGMVATRSMLSVSRSADPDSDLAVQVGGQFGPGSMPLTTGPAMGIRQGELLLLGGAPGAGKTTLCLQMARNIAVSGQANVLYACYEHPPEYVLDRLLVQETIDPAAPGPVSGISLDEFQALLAEAVRRYPNAGPYELCERTRSLARRRKSLTATQIASTWSPTRPERMTSAPFRRSLPVTATRAASRSCSLWITSRRSIRQRRASAQRMSA